MRLWSLHPKYLDTRGLTALWREALLAQKVLLGKTKGYRSHPQLARFRKCADPVLAIGYYLKAVLNEADERGYRFDGAKIVKPWAFRKMKVRRGQLEYEWGHLLGKLRTRDPERYKKSKGLTRPKPHPLFAVVPGGGEDWERVKIKQTQKAILLSRKAAKPQRTAGKRVKNKHIR